MISLAASGSANITPDIIERTFAEILEQSMEGDPRIEPIYIHLISSYFAAYTNDESYLDSLVEIHRIMHGPTPMNAEPEPPVGVPPPLDVPQPPSRASSAPTPMNSGPAASASIDTRLPGVSVLDSFENKEVTSRPRLTGKKRQPVGTPNGESVGKRTASLPTEGMEVED